MKILLLGATGRTGKQVLEQALQRGYTVHVVVRNSQQLPVHAQLIVFEGTPSDSMILSKAIQGCEAIFSTLNISRVNDFPWSRLRSPTNFLSTVMKNLIILAEQEHIQRIIFTTAWGVADSSQDIPGWFRWIIYHSNIRYAYEDHAVQEELLKHTALQWTAVRPVGLSNRKRKDEIKVSLNNNPRPKLLVSRTSVATFMLDILEQEIYIRQAPVVFQ